MLLSAVGCSDDNMQPVSGTVYFEGETSPIGKISFYPIGRKGRTASGKIKSDGTYRLSSLEPGDGAPPGEYKVTIWVPKTTPQGVGDLNTTNEVEWVIPPVYADPTTTPLRQTVEGGQGVIDFHITSTPPGS